MIVYAKNNTELDYYAEFSLLEVRWIGILDKEILGQLWHKVVELITKHAIKYVLLDASHVKIPHHSADFTRLAQQFYTQQLPLSSILNLTKVARVSAGLAGYDHTIARFFEHLHAQNQISFTFANFSHHYEAMDWLTDGGYSVKLK